MARLLRPRFTSSALTNSRWVRAAEAIRTIHPNIPREWTMAMAANRDTLNEDLPEGDAEAMRYAKRWWGDRRLA
ncbi:hypothetical protein MY11210_006598 [Beauveria gryllotalpidicola]